MPALPIRLPRRRGLRGGPDERRREAERRAIGILRWARTADALKLFPWFLYLGCAAVLTESGSVQLAVFAFALAALVKLVATVALHLRLERQNFRAARGVSIGLACVQSIYTVLWTWSSYVGSSEIWESVWLVAITLVSQGFAVAHWYVVAALWSSHAEREKHA